MTSQFTDKPAHQQTRPLLYSVENNVATLAINRPKRRNALSAEVIGLLLDGLDSAENDPTVRAVVITGTGDKAFCAGADLGGGVGGKGTLEYAKLLKRIVQFPKPTVARVFGYCLAGGMGIMLACDMVISAETAQFGTPEINVGLWPMMIGALIQRNLSPKQAMPMILLGERFGAKKAYEMGFLSQLVADVDLDTTITTITAKLTTKSPISIKIGKAAFYATQDMPLEAALDYLSEQLSAVAATHDAKEGVQAFMQKRPPHFIGK